MKILIIDNEAGLRAILKNMVLLLNANYTVAEASGVADGVEKINTFKLDVVLLDVEMDDGTGFDLLQQLQQHHFQLIFTTAHNQYAVQAFRCSAIDYLLKPIDPIELHHSLQKAQEQIGIDIMKQQLQVLLQQVAKTSNEDAQIVLKDSNKTYFVNINDILYCKADGAYTIFNLMNKTTIYQSHNLRYYEEMLEGNIFIRVHHSYLVNKHKITQLNKKDDAYFVTLQNGENLPVSQRKKELVQQALLHN